MTVVRRGERGVRGSGPELILERLFSDPEVGVWAILDGASVQGLVRAIGTHGVESSCLFAGELDPSMARVAPYLVALEGDSEFCAWLLERGWGRHWGIFLRSRADLRTLRKHLRSFLMVKDPEGKLMQFRYYDPRVLRVYLPTCNAEETAAVFGPVESYAMESGGARELLVFAPGSVPPVPEAIPLDDV